MSINMILDTLVEATKKRIERQKQEQPMEKLMQLAAKTCRQKFLFEETLGRPGMHFICEVKKASPSKGLIASEFPYLQIAGEYEAAGADCISVLTETDYFLGSDQYFMEIRQQVQLPMLRKDFTIDPYMIYQAKAMGADCVLLICAILQENVLKEYLQLCDRLGMSALVETHTEDEVRMAVRAGARLLGVNNRNLATFEVDLSTSRRLRELVPKQIIFVAESGIRTAEDIRELSRAGVQGVLVGETLMRSRNKGAMLRELAAGSEIQPEKEKADVENSDAENSDTAQSSETFRDRKRSCRVKICGLKTEEDVRIINSLRPEYAGFVFAGKKRKISDEQAMLLRQQLHPEIKTVGVFVNEPPEHILSLCREGIIDMIQLHGDEQEEFVRELRKQSGKPVIRAVRIQSVRDIIQAADSAADYLLFDSFQAGIAGGSGESFCWDWIAKAEQELSVQGKVLPKYFLAGGLSPENAAMAAGFHPFALDVSSGVETEGKKDEKRIAEFLAACSQIE